MRVPKEKKSLILEKAFKLFLKKSFKEVTMREIVRETGISKGAFYHYFPTKESLFNNIIDTYYLNFFQIDYTLFNQDRLQNFYMDYIVFLRKEMDYMAMNFADKFEISTLNYYMMIFDALHIYPGFREKSIEVANRELRNWINVVKISRERGEINSVMEDEQIAKLFVRVNDGIGMYSIMQGTADKMLDEIEEIYNGIYNEIRS